MKYICGVLAAWSVVAASTLFAGGWAVVTVTKMPPVLVAGRPAQIEFVVRQHGQHLMANAAASLQADADGVKVTAVVRSSSMPGTYVADVVLPAPGRWTFTLTSGLFDRATWVMPAVAAGQNPPAETAAQVGLRLFNAKGCATCHVHQAAAATSSVNLGPDLSGRGYQPDALAASVLWPKPCVSGRPCMPALEVDATEVAALSAFLTADRPLRAAR
jgi:hypothetical protein